MHYAQRYVDSSSDELNSRWRCLVSLAQSALSNTLCALEGVAKSLWTAVATQSAISTRRKLCCGERKLLNKLIRYPFQILLKWVLSSTSGDVNTTVTTFSDLMHRLHIVFHNLQSTWHYISRILATTHNMSWSQLEAICLTWLKLTLTKFYRLAHSVTLFLCPSRPIL